MAEVAELPPVIRSPIPRYLPRYSVHGRHFERYRWWFLFGFEVRAEVLVAFSCRPRLASDEGAEFRRLYSGEVRQCPVSLFYNEAAVGVFCRPPTWFDHGRIIRRNVRWALVLYVPWCVVRVWVITLLS